VIVATSSWGVVLALAMAFCWAGTGVALRGVPVRLDVLLVTGLRALVGMLATVLLVLLAGRIQEYRLLTARQVFFLLASAVAGGVVADVLYLSSLRLLGMNRCFPIVNSYPLFTVAYSAVLLGERITWRTLTGAAVVFLGVYLVARPKDESRGPSGAALGLGRLAGGVGMAVATAACYGIEAILISLGAIEVNSAVANSVRVPLVALIALPLAALRGACAELRQMTWRAWIPLAAAGAIGWGLAGTLWVAAVKAIGPGRAAIIGSTAPLFAVPLSMVILKERPTRLTLLGTALTIVGIILVT